MTWLPLVIKIVILILGYFGGRAHGAFIEQTRAPRYNEDR